MMKNFLIALATTLICALTIVTASGANEIGVALFPDGRPLAGSEVTIKADTAGVPDVIQVTASIDTNGVAVDINGEDEGTDLVLAPQSGSAATQMRAGFSGDTEGLFAIRRPMGFHLRVTGYGSEEEEVTHTDLHFDSRNLRVEATSGPEAGRAVHVFKPGDIVRFIARVGGEPSGVSVDVLDIFSADRSRQQVDLTASTGATGVWTANYTLPSTPADYLADTLRVSQGANGSAQEQAVPAEPRARFTTDPIEMRVGVVPSAASAVGTATNPNPPPKEVLVPVFIGNKDDGHESVDGKGILASEFEIHYEYPALDFVSVLLLDGIAEQSDHRVVFNKIGNDHVKITTAGAAELAGEGPLFYLKFKVGTPNYNYNYLYGFPPEDGLADVSISSVVFETEHIRLFTGPIINGGVSALVGDVNYSGQITAFDGIIILKNLVGLDVHPIPTPLDLRVADVNRDDRLSALDAALIFRYDAGLITELPPPGPRPKLASPVAQSVGLADASPSGADLVVPVRVSDLAGLMAADLTLSYNPSAFVVSGIVPGASLDGWSVASNQAEGKIRIALAGANSVQGEGDLAVITLRPLSDQSLSTSPLTITRAALNDQVVRIVAAENGQSTPVAYSLLQNSPNPFNPETQVSYNLPRASSVTLAVYDLTGQAVRTLVSAQQAAGSYTVSWDGRDDRGQAVASGAYVYRLTAGSFSATKKMVMMK